MKSFFKSLFEKKFDRAAVKLPLVGKQYESNVKGIHLIGEIGGKPLLKNAINMGYEIIDKLYPLVKDNHVNGVYDILIVGAGAAGISASLRAKQKGLDYVTIEQGKLANLITTFTKGKKILSEPLNIKLKGDIWLEETTKEDILAKWEKLAHVEDLNIKTKERILSIKQDNGTFEVKTNKGDYLAKRVILSIGKSGNPRKINCPGEDLDKVSHILADPDEFIDKDVMIYGGGDMAAEAALSLCDRNRTTIVYKGSSFTSPRKRNIDALNAKIEEGKINVYFNSKPKEIRENEVVIETNGKASIEKNDHFFTMIGSDLPHKFFNMIGIRLEGEWHAKRILLAILVSVVVFCIYSYKKYPSYIPFSFIPAETFYTWFAPFGEGKDALFHYRDTTFWYSLIYTLAMIIFGVKAYRRWGTESNSRYQKIRYISLISCQVILFFLIPEFLFKFLVHIGNPYQYWHAYSFLQPWPLLFYFIFDHPGLFYLIWAGVLTLIIVPVTAIWHGKRFCTWVCGCGGLAETFGDRWRHLAPKGKKAAAWEFMTWIILGWAVLAMIFFFALPSFGVHIIKSYTSIVDFWLIAVIPVAAYPFFGGKIWCRYWCPLAKYIQIISKWFGKLKITSNDKCITCGECSRYCQVGIDVMGFARNQYDFSNKNTSCIHCGICITVCPMDVLKFGDQK
ncbi:MAG: NAD(P)-binding domain-containing protein [Candidatus Anammoxibacter sp.]